MALADTEFLETRNPDWGFFGTIAHRACPRAAWELASRAIAEATDSGSEGIRDFLDSRLGRHFADDVANGLFQGLSIDEAVREAVARWMSWRTGRHEEREHDIPRGLPLLYAWVTFHEINGA